MAEYRKIIHGGDIKTCEELYNCNNFLDFSCNINLFGLPKSVKEALINNIDKCTNYPDPLCRDLKLALSKFENINKDYILCGNGAADIIYRICYALKPKTALLLSPTFAEYEQALLQSKCKINFHELIAANDFALEKDFIKKIAGVDIVFLCNPNNPTGQLIKQDFLHEILLECNKRGAFLVVDECFLSFLINEDEYSVKKFLGNNSNLIILKAFTKIFAMPGIRLGYALCSNLKLLSDIEQVGAPWSVSIIAQICGIAAVEESEYLAQSCKYISLEAQSLANELSKLGLKVFKPSVNYILFYTDKINLDENLCKRGIIIRNCKNYRGLKSGYLRVAVRSKADNNLLLQAIENELELMR